MWLPRKGMKIRCVFAPEADYRILVKRLGAHGPYNELWVAKTPKGGEVRVAVGTFWVPCSKQ